MNHGPIWRVWFPMIAGLWALLLVFMFGSGPRGPARWLGLVLGLIGLSGVIVARYTLGQSFSIAPKARVLVTRGIYSRIRNPIYVSGEVFLIGVALMLWRPSILVIFLVLIPIQILRARREAAVLEEKFGEEYREYRRRTWF